MFVHLEGDRIQSSQKHRRLEVSWRRNLKTSEWNGTVFKLRYLRLLVLSEVVKAPRKPIYYEVEDSSGDETQPRLVAGAALHIDVHEYVHQCMAEFSSANPAESSEVSKIVDIYQS